MFDSMEFKLSYLLAVPDHHITTVITVTLRSMTLLRRYIIGDYPICQIVSNSRHSAGTSDFFPSRCNPQHMSVLGDWRDFNTESRKTTMYSMLRSTLLLKKKVDIKKFSKLKA